MRLTVNGRTCQLDVAPDATLLSVLRDQLYLTGAKPSCERGECGACTVLVADPEGKPSPVYSCLALAHAYENESVTTIEGLSFNGTHPLQKAWIAEQVPQCGYCQSGQIMQAAELLAKTKQPTREQIVAHMDGNICRCGTYSAIVSAIETAARG